MKSFIFNLIQFLFFLLATILFFGCKQDIVSTDSNLYLTFSRDSLAFDTVFTEQGTATQQVMVYNPHDHAVAIARVWLDGHDETGKSYFTINLDGENNMAYMDRIEVRGHDSLYLFVKANIDPLDEDIPLLIEDELHILVNGNIASLKLSAIGWNVTRLQTPALRTDVDNYTFSAQRPYLLYDTLVVHGDMTIDAGARIYLHKGASIICTGNVTADATIDQPIILQGDRLDRLFDSVPYAYAAGQWGGVYLLPEEDTHPTYLFNYVEIRSGNTGLFIQHTPQSPLPSLTLSNSRIHNHNLYGLVLINTNAQVYNTEISNTAHYCVFAAGGTHQFTHTTIASFFNNTNIRIQSAQRQSMPAVYIDSISTDALASNTSFINCIIDGLESNNLHFASFDTTAYQGIVSHCYLRTDSLAAPWAKDNVYAFQVPDSTVFRQKFYRYKEYIYYNFQLDSLSPANGIGDPSVVVPPLDYDRLGTYRLPAPDAGCYQTQTFN